MEVFPLNFPEISRSRQV